MTNDNTSKWQIIFLTGLFSISTLYMMNKHKHNEIPTKPKRQIPPPMTTTNKYDELAKLIEKLNEKIESFERRLNLLDEKVNKSISCSITPPTINLNQPTQYLDIPKLEKEEEQKIKPLPSDSSFDKELDEGITASQIEHTQEVKRKFWIFNY